MWSSVWFCENSRPKIDRLPSKIERDFSKFFYAQTVKVLMWEFLIKMIRIFTHQNQRSWRTSSNPSTNSLFCTNQKKSIAIKFPFSLIAQTAVQRISNVCKYQCDLPSQFGHKTTTVTLLQCSTVFYILFDRNSKALSPLGLIKQPASQKVLNLKRKIEKLPSYELTNLNNRNFLLIGTFQIGFQISEAPRKAARTVRRNPKNFVASNDRTSTRRTSTRTSKHIVFQKQSGPKWSTPCPLFKISRHSRSASTIWAIKSQIHHKPHGCSLLRSSKSIEGFRLKIAAVIKDQASKRKQQFV